MILNNKIVLFLLFKEPEMKTKIHKIALTISFLSLISTTNLAFSNENNQETKIPQKTILNISSKNQNKDKKITLEDLDKLPQIQFTTSTPWEKGKTTFSGPLLKDVLQLANIKEGKILAYALNDYRIELPYDDAVQYEVIVATRKDGEIMHVRDKGPLFVVYNFDSNPKLKSAVYYERSIWQLKKIEVN